MKKVPTIFKRNPENMKEILIDKNPICNWVFKGEGIATRKYDGTCVMFENGIMYKRRTIKKNKIPPLDFVKVDFDPNTEKSFGWVPVQDSDKIHKEVFNHGGFDDGTYELLGPKIQGNPEEWSIHVIVSHKNAKRFPDCPRTFAGLKEWLKDKDIEGVVFHHSDGRMGKIKKRDFGFKRL